MLITPLFQGWVKSVAALGCVALLAACGGGSGKSSTAASLSSASSLSSSSSLSTSSSLSSASKVSSVSSLSSASSSVAPDTTPDAFGFTPVTNAALNVSITSNAITISGINTPTSISIIGGQYTIGRGAPTSDAGKIANGQTVKVTLTTAATPGTSTQAVLTVGGVTGSFSAATTKVIGGAIQGLSLNISGVVTTLAGTSRVADGIGLAATFLSPQGVVSDGTNLYVADGYNNKIRKIVIATGVVTTLAGSGSLGSADGAGLTASFAGPQGMVSDGSNLYVTDTQNNKIRKVVIATGTVTTLAGSGSEGSTDGDGTAASFYQPIGIASDGASLYVTDSNRVRKIVIATGAVTTLASGSYGGTDDLGYPAGITSDGANLYIASTYNNKIRKIVISTGAVSTLAGSGSEGSADGTGTAASFYQPYGITSDGTNLYVADRGNIKIRKIVIATGAVTTFAGGGASYSQDGIGTAASFYSPTAITSDGASLYVADTSDNKIRKIVIATRVVTTLAGGNSEGSADGTGIAANFKNPIGITSDGTNLYVADTYNNKIRKIVIATGVVTTLAGRDSEGSADGTGVEASFNMPRGITSDGTNLYVADTSNNSIRKIVIETGEVTTLAGGWIRGSGFSEDGTGREATFRSPTGITSDGTNLYVADTSDNTIRKIVIATGAVTTLAGSYSAGSADGTGTMASFNEPTGITSDGANLYVADNGNNSIRKIAISTGVVTTLVDGSLLGGQEGIGIAFTYRNVLTCDGANLYVANNFNHIIRKIVISTGVVTTLAGSGAQGSADGIGTMVGFGDLGGITSDGFSLFVTDSRNNTIRKIQ